jgi:2-polyprenyl-3-methyl-5-hydroxy-6-metoxy-1,4-benzoquinol methylase
VNCRHCTAALTSVVLDLGSAPPSNAYLSVYELARPEVYLPLKLLVCESCWLVQTEDHSAPADLFRHDYAYFSSVSSSWIDHARRYVRDITLKLGLSPTSLVIEVGANDGYLLENFVTAGIPCLGIEPTESTARVAEGRSIPILREFFGAELGRKLGATQRRADLIVVNNVFAHVPDINDFTIGLREALKPTGTITIEFPHLLRLLSGAQFDTVYHEHFSYLSLDVVCRIFAAHGLQVYDAEELSTHGGSLRIYGGHVDQQVQRSQRMIALLAGERIAGLQSLRAYEGLQAIAERVKDDLLCFLIDQKRAGRSVAGYGAAAKGNTLLNFAGVRPDLLPYVCDAAPAKQGKFLPGSHIPIVSPDMMLKQRPDIVLILPWNIADEVIAQYSSVRDWGGEFHVAVPALRRVGA